MFTGLVYPGIWWLCLCQSTAVTCMCRLTNSTATPQPCFTRISYLPAPPPKPDPRRRWFDAFRCDLEIYRPPARIAIDRPWRSQARANALQLARNKRRRFVQDLRQAA